MGDCTKTLTATDAAQIQDVVDALPSGAVLCLQAATYPGPLWLEKTITIRAEGEVVLDGRQEGLGLMVAKPGLDIVIEGVAFKRGFSGVAGRGANVTLAARSSLLLRRCKLLDGVSEASAGGALAEDGTLTLEQCWLEGNVGNGGTQLRLTGGGKAVVRDSTIVGRSADVPAVGARGATTLTIERSVVWNGSGSPIELGSVGSTAPMMTIDHSIVGTGKVILPVREMPKIRIDHSALFLPIAGAQSDADTVYGAIELDRSYRPVAGKPYSTFGPKP
jgi:hypothetical protein